MGRELTPALLRDWVQEGLIDGPRRVGGGRGKGSKQFWPPQADRQLLRVCNLQARGLGRFSALRLALWLNDLRAYSVSMRKFDLRKEFRRLRKQSLRSPVQASKSAPDLRGDFQDLKAFMSYGSPTAPILTLADELVRELPLLQGTAIKADLTNLFLASMGQLLGEPEDAEPLTDESAETLISETTNSDWETAKAVLRQLPWMLLKGNRLLELSGWGGLGLMTSHGMQLVREFTAPNWRIALLVPLLTARRRNPEIFNTLLIVPPAIAVMRNLLAANINRHRFPSNHRANDAYSEMSVLLRPPLNCDAEKSAGEELRQCLLGHGLPDLETLARKSRPLQP